jgi:predicted nucleotidyltransferase
MTSEILSKIASLPQKSKDVVGRITKKLIDGLGDNLVSIILFGSAAEGEFIEGKSDINLLIVLLRARAIDLNIIIDVGRKFIGKGLAIPLIFEKDHVSTSLDTFPIEFSDMKRRHIVLFGEDPLEKAVIEGKNLRYQCERELKSMLVNLRRGFLQTDGKGSNIQSVLENSLSSLLAACRGLIWLSGITPPDETAAILGAVRETYSTSTASMERVWELRQGKSGATATLEMIFDDYTSEITRLIGIVDRL